MRENIYSFGLVIERRERRIEIRRVDDELYASIFPRYSLSSNEVKKCTWNWEISVLNFIVACGLKLAIENWRKFRLIRKRVYRN